MTTPSDLDLSQVRLPAAQASCLPPVCYTSPEICEAEIARLFRQSWLCVGRSDMVTGPGDYIALDFAGQSLILLRDTEGVLRAYANSCRHRAARLVDGEGRCKGLRCPFHSWFYGLDGRLVSAPRMDAAEGFEKSDHGLHAYACEERFGFAFVCLAADAPPLDADLDGFAEIHAPWPLDRLVTIRRQELEVACNWKAFLEVFNEYYHLPFVHPDSIDSVYAPPDAPEEVAGAFATQFGATEGTGGLLEDTQSFALPPIPGMTGRAASGARYTWVFPNMAFAANTDALWCYEAYPLGPDRCKVVQSSCFPPESMALPYFAEKSAVYLDRMDAALAEDVPALENQQRGFACPDARAGRFQPDLEPSVAGFARWYARRMQSNS
ncbi:aromatic ring-hydroxylating dioxygenase subunit alpha [Roseovarius faecimaris]|uniref:Aromatic ring-hydroxylating dioxygenase subunit alpha n=1 Tax=Roseovarius faecimaris TaxID=2494550 RepID=A0A6I6IMH7_9RHOB|nr:aromatic ring-hydroxylating dioxygenase subunit alpha [Roseovarius faecimaris]QGX98209.1 aromatic ring-hydroxylating dioxygenase subunit alpha [Roseovarius faecimaris]